MSKNDPENITTNANMAVWMTKQENSMNNVEASVQAMKQRLSNIDNNIAKISGERLTFFTRAEWNEFYRGEYSDHRNEFNQFRGELDKRLYAAMSIISIVVFLLSMFAPEIKRMLGG